MTRLKLADLADEKPVRLAVEVLDPRSCVALQRDPERAEGGQEPVRVG